jgi:hypothetical protein
VVSLVLSCISGSFAIGELVSPERPLPRKETSAPPPGLPPYVDPAINERLVEAQLSALKPMRESRSLVLGALSVACAFVFVSAGRMLRPAGLPLERVRRLLAAASITAALLRTIVGAQDTVVFKRMAVVMAEALSHHPELKTPELVAQFKATILFVMSAAMVFQTALIAGTFALLGQYFRGESVRQAVLAQGGEELAEEED